MGVLFLVMSFVAFAISVYHQKLFEYTSLGSIINWSVFLLSVVYGCWLIFRR